MGFPRRCHALLAYKATLFLLIIINCVVYYYYITSIFLFLWCMYGIALDVICKSETEEKVNGTFAKDTDTRYQHTTRMTQHNNTRQHPGTDNNNENF